MLLPVEGQWQVTGSLPMKSPRSLVIHLEVDQTTGPASRFVLLLGAVVVFVLLRWFALF